MRPPPVLGLAILALSCGYHLGPAPLAVDAVTLGAVSGPGGELTLEDELRAALADALANRALASGGPELRAQILRAEDRSASVGAAMQQVEVVVQLELATVPVRTVTLSGREGYALQAADPLGSEVARRAAVRALMRRLAEDAVAQLVGAGS